MAAKRRGSASRRAGAKVTDAQATAETSQSARAGNPEAHVPPTRMGGVLSATGQAVSQALGHEHVPKGKDRGAQDSPKGIQPDYLKGAKPQGLQKEAARFVSNGEVDLRLTPTAGGPQPQLAATHAEGEDKIQERMEAHDTYVEARSVTRDKRLSEATINRLGGAELRAIAAQRGYTDFPDHGNRTIRGAFAKAQEQDKNLGKEEI